MRPLSEDQIQDMQAWFNASKARAELPAAKMDYLGEVKLGQNFTFDAFLKIVTENNEQLYWFGPEVEVPMILLYVVIIVFGLFANGLICYVIVKRKKLQTVRNIFIVNLAVSDMIMCILCMPFTLVKLLLKNWPLGDAMCRLVPWLQAVNVFASTMTITAIALDRYQVIVYPSTIKDKSKKMGAAAIIILIWFMSVLVGLPLLVYSRLEQKEYIKFINYQMCLEEWPSPIGRTVYAGAIMLLQFIIPVIILIIIHWRICTFLKTRIRLNPTTPMEMNRAMKEAKRHRKNSTLLMAIAVMFALCWFPLTLLNLLADFNYFIFMYKNFLLAFSLAHLIAMVSACLNPVIYGWFNSNFRREFTRIVCFWREDLYDIERKQLVQVETRRVVYKRNVSYKAIQTEVQPMFDQHDCPFRDSDEDASSRSGERIYTK